MTETTVIRNASWVVGWDRRANAHVYLRDADVVFAADRLTHVGRRYDGPADRVIDGRARLAMPGLVNIHAHPSSEPLNKGYMEEVGSRNLYMGGYYEYASVMFVPPDDDARIAATEVAYCELLKSGCTSVADLSYPYDTWIDVAARSGLRVWLGPMYRSGRPYTPDGNRVIYEWDEPAGWKKMEQSMAIIDAARQHPSGRLSGLVVPAQIDTCTVDLLAASLRAARERDVVLQTHGAQNWIEFHEMTRRHGKTPVEFMAEIGILGPRAILAHAIFIDRHPTIHWWSERDLSLLAESGVTVAHCPTPYSRRGVMLHDFGRYLRAGVRMGIGTDAYPLNMLDDMHRASLLAKVAARDVLAVTTADVFYAATIGGANALEREDLGRLVPGAKADLVLVDLTHPSMRPLREPLRSLLFCATDRAVTDVYVDGRQVVAGGRVVSLDHDDALGRAEAAQRRMEQEAPRRDWAHRSAEEASPMALPVVDALS